MGEILIIGAGAAGLAAAIAAASDGHAVVILEKNERIGKKLYITGKGRCNLTNGCEPQDFFRHVISNPKFLYSAFYSFSNEDVMEFFRKAGCEVKEERGMRIFPVSDHSADVIDALRNECRRLGVKIRLHTEVREILTRDGRTEGVRLADGSRLSCTSLIVATGGLSYPSTGSTGDGYRFAEALGHTIRPTSPSLVPMNIEEPWCAEVSGLALKNVSLTLRAGSKELYSEQGEMLFTHFGISGPLVLTASCHAAPALAAGQKLSVLIDLKPALSEQMLDERLQRDFLAAGTRELKNACDKLLPRNLIPIVIEASGILPDRKVNLLTREERLQLVRTLKGLELHVKGLRDYQEAIITRGGINVKEVDPHTMESKLVKGLYFAGEVLDLDAETGGFNLQIAWSTGTLAGHSVS